MFQKIHSCLVVAICCLSLSGCAGYNITKDGTGAGYDVF